ncbi:imm11 family protein [Rhizobium binae]|uniref:imm11 family protein n=1 Tax=Rhizobium binae TaxID=1138190 RepID=UPI0031BAC61E
MSSARAKPKKVYMLYSNGNYGWEFANLDSLQPNGGGLGLNHRGTPWPDSMLDLPRGPWRIPEYLEKPKLIFDPTRKVQDIYSVDYFLFISDKMKRLLDEFAPKSCEYLLCETKFSNGKVGPRIWLCSVVDSYLNAVDVENSPLIRVTRGGGYMISGGADWCFLPNVLRGAQLFRLVEYAVAFFCDQTFKDICKEKGIKGATFRQVGFLKQL